MAALLSSAAVSSSYSRTVVASRYAILSCVSGLLLLFAIQPRWLFFGDQNTYFLHGVARAGYGFLANDWLVSTKSPLPLFDALVEFTWRYFGSNGLYILQTALFIMLSGALLLLLRCSQLQIRSGWSAPLMVFTALAAIWGWAPAPLSTLLRDGFAVQTIISDKLEPSSFGILLLISVALFAAERTGFASAAAALASLVHPTYLVASTILAVVYGIYTTLEDRRVIPGLRFVLIYFVLVSPIVLFLFLEFSPTNAESYRQATEVLVYQRIPYHALPQVWLSRYSLFTVAIIALGIWAWLRPHPRLAYVIAASSGAILVLTIVATMVNWAPFYLLFPWRLSVVLVPIATLGIISRILDFVWRRSSAHGFSPVLRIISLALAAALFISSGAVVMSGKAKTAGSDSPEYRDRDYDAVIKIASSDPDPMAVYLYPPRLFESFRLRTGHATFVDFKSHPFKDVEVLDWWARLQWADRFFAGDACRNEPAPYEFNRIVLPGPAHAIAGSMMLPADSLKHCLLGLRHWCLSFSVPGYDILAACPGTALVRYSTNASHPATMLARPPGTNLP